MRLGLSTESVHNISARISSAQIAPHLSCHVRLHKRCWTPQLFRPRPPTAFMQSAGQTSDRTTLHATACIDAAGRHSLSGPDPQRLSCSLLAKLQIAPHSMRQLAQTLLGFTAFQAPTPNRSHAVCWPSTRSHHTQAESLHRRCWTPQPFRRQPPTALMWSIRSDGHSPCWHAFLLSLAAGRVSLSLTRGTPLANPLAGCSGLFWLDAIHRPMPFIPAPPRTASTKTRSCAGFRRSVTVFAIA
jgi:hypothetical protein